MSNKVPSYEEVKKQFTGVSHLLIGNGFSIDCDPIFWYGSLYDKAVENGLSFRAQSVFQKLGTNNFEAAMNALALAHWMANLYGLFKCKNSEFLDDLEIVKKTLVKSIAESHPEHTGLISDTRKRSAGLFFADYKNVFTTNYDLLPCWVNMAFSAPPLFQDNFREDKDNGESLIFTDQMRENRGMYFIHGALHIYMEGKNIRKHAWSRTGERITSSVRKGLEVNQFPLFVAEGEADKKLEQIRRNGYLNHCYEKLGRIENRIVTFGFSFGESDSHICSLIARTTRVRQLVVGVRGSLDSLDNQGMVASIEMMKEKRLAVLKKEGKTGKGGKPGALEVIYYQSETANVWSQPPSWKEIFQDFIDEEAPEITF